LDIEDSTQLTRRLRVNEFVIPSIYRVLIRKQPYIVTRPFMFRVIAPVDQTSCELIYGAKSVSNTFSDRWNFTDMTYTMSFLLDFM